MAAEVDEGYPGEAALARDLLRLAEEYRLGAELLLLACRRGEPLSQAPFRHAALHAIELYLNAVLLDHGVAPATVRGLQHDFGRRAQMATEAGLTLRRRTAAHLAELAAAREHLVARYCADRVRPPPPNRLAASLREVAAKSSRLVARDAAAPTNPPG